VIPSREALDERYAEVAAAYGEDVPLPETWGGYRLRPCSIEFWQHRASRLHDRLCYRLDEGDWIVERLAP
jgi:pyridoxamine 5'-phosphate oxidase